MRRGIGIACIILGLSCLLCALGFLAYNRWEATNAGRMSQSFLAEVQNSIAQGQGEAPTATQAPPVAEGDPKPTETPGEEEALQMPTVKVNGYDSIGILSIPVLELELPVLTDWSYAKLKIAPCLYYGNCYEPNFVLAAHNYTAHFGKLSKLHPGDMVLFTDALGTVYAYEVVLLETLPKEATETMLTAGFDLSLYTCTLGGGSRITVRCNRITP